MFHTLEKRSNLEIRGLEAIPVKLVAKALLINEL